MLKCSTGRSRQRLCIVCVKGCNLPCCISCMRSFKFCRLWLPLCSNYCNRCVSTTIDMHEHQCWYGRLSSCLLVALLQALANQVCEKVESKQRTTYNEVADELVSEFGNVEGTGQNVAVLISSNPACIAVLLSTPLSPFQCCPVLSKIPMQTPITSCLYAWLTITCASLYVRCFPKHLQLFLNWC